MFFSTIVLVGSDDISVVDDDIWGYYTCGYC